MGNLLTSSVKPEDPVNMVKGFFKTVKSKLSKVMDTVKTFMIEKDSSKRSIWLEWPEYHVDEFDMFVITVPNFDAHWEETNDILSDYAFFYDSI